MSAKRPIRVTDLVKKYGWEIQHYLSALGLENLAEAQILFVDSNATNALDADDGYHGHSLINPLATWDYANGLCTSGESSVIILAPRHNENLGEAQIDLDVSDVHTIGMGSGLLKPRIDFGHANSSINFAANNVTVQGVDFLPAITSILIGVHFETNVVGCWLKDCVFLIGEDGSGADEFIKAVELTSGNDDCGFEDVVILAHDSASQATHGIHVDAAADRLTFKNVIIDGPYATGGIVEDATGVNHIVENCAVDVSGTNYDFDGSSTFAKRVNNENAGYDSTEEAITLATDLIGVIRGNGLRNFFVDDARGSDAYDGLTSATAKATIGAAVVLANAAGDDCTIYVAGENYSEAQITVTANRLKILSVNGSKEMPLWQNSAPTVGSHLLIQASQVEVAGFRLHHASSSTTPAIIIDGQTLGNAAWIHGNYFSSSGSAPSSGGIEIRYQAFDHMIEDNEFFLLTGSGKTGGAIYEAGGFANAPVSCTIRNNRFFNCATCISISAKSFTITGNLFAGFNQDDSETTGIYLNLLHVASSGFWNGDAVEQGNNVVAGNYFADHFSWEIDSVHGYWFSDTDAVSGNYCKDGIMGRGGPSAGGADAHDVQLVPGKTYSMSKALTGGWSAAAQDLFVVAGGPIRVISLTGTVTAAIKATTMNLSLVAAVTTPSGSIDIASNVDCTNDDPGTILTLNSAFGSALVELTNGVGANGGDFIMPIGTINMTSEAVDNEGAGIRWDIEFIPLAVGVSVTPA